MVFHLSVLSGKFIICTKCNIYESRSGGKIVSACGRGVKSGRVLEVEGENVPRIT